MHTAATLQRQRLFYAHLHIGVFLLALVVPDKATFPKRTDRLDTLDFVWLLSLTDYVFAIGATALLQSATCSDLQGT